MSGEGHLPACGCAERVIDDLIPVTDQLQVALSAAISIMERDGLDPDEVERCALYRSICSYIGRVPRGC